MDSQLGKTPKKHGFEILILTNYEDFLKIIYYKSHFCQHIALYYGWSYCLEPFRPIASYCPEPFRPIASYCPEPFRPITSYCPEPLPANNKLWQNLLLAGTLKKKYRIRYMRAPHMFFFSVKVFEKVLKLENSPFYRNGLQY